jgi:hypothetical protein
MNQTQRKYSLERIRAIAATKKNEVIAQFNIRPENQKRPIPSMVYPSTIEVICAINGDDNGVVLLSREEMISSIRSYGTALYVSNFVKARNQLDIDEVNAYNTAIDRRYQTEVTRTLQDIDIRATACTDRIMLCGNEEAVAALREFEAFVPIGVSSDV